MDIILTNGADFIIDSIPVSANTKKIRIECTDENGSSSITDLIVNSEGCCVEKRVFEEITSNKETINFADEYEPSPVPPYEIPTGYGYQPTEPYDIPPDTNESTCCEPPEDYYPALAEAPEYDFPDFEDAPPVDEDVIQMMENISFEEDLIPIFESEQTSEPESNSAFRYYEEDEPEPPVLDCETELQEIPWWVEYEKEEEEKARKLAEEARPEYEKDVSRIVSLITRYIDTIDAVTSREFGKAKLHTLRLEKVYKTENKNSLPDKTLNIEVRETASGNIDGRVFNVTIEKLEEELLKIATYKHNIFAGKEMKYCADEIEHSNSNEDSPF